MLNGTIDSPQQAVGFYADCYAVCFPKEGVRVKVAKLNANGAPVVQECDGTTWDVAFDTLKNFSLVS